MIYILYLIGYNFIPVNLLITKVTFSLMLLCIDCQDMKYKKNKKKI